MVLQIQNDADLSIAVGLSAQSKVWRNTKIRWSALVERLSQPVVTSETHARFMSATKAEQGRIKDVGGFVGGILINGRRDKKSVLSRQLVTLDIDFSHAGFWADFTILFDCAAVLHATHKSSPAAPRHRLIIPLDRDVSQEEYQAISRKVAGILGIELFDPSTYDVNRLMFWPSVSSDAKYDFEYQDGPFLCADDVLAMYGDWHDIAEWPAPDGEGSVRSEAAKQEDPTAKKGIIGAFCRTYSVQEAIEAFLSDKYARVDDNRYTYLGGTTAGGLVVYEDKYAYSHHGTDPAGGKLCNAFDLVRIHKFGNLDNGKEEGKSLRAMEEFAAADGQVRRQIFDEKTASAAFDFAAPLPEAEEGYDDSWTSGMDVSAKGEYENTANNFNLIIQNDKYLKGAFGYNTFDNRRYVLKSLPWRESDGNSLFRDVDYAGLRNYIECVYGCVSNQKVDDALALAVERKRFHPIREYLDGLAWDGVQRIDFLLTDYFGAEDTPYTRAAIRKMLVGAVARVFQPGVKLDLALILVGAQGTYKSTFVKKLGREWFSDTFLTVQGKEAFEQLQGAWLIEMGELSGLKKAEVETIKQYISKCEDSFRPAYGRVVETYKRQCVFFGTTNDRTFLRDPTGNRRFLPVDVRPDSIVKSVTEDMTDDEVDQIWAEACVLYRAGEPLYLSKEEDEMAREEQTRHMDTDERAGVIEKYLSRLFPGDWDTLDLYQRRRWLDDPLACEGTERKECTCVAEVWCECLGKDKSEMSRYNTRELNDILKTMPGWEPVGVKSFPIYGRQRCYKRL